MDVKDYLPHRHEFQLIDKIIEIKHGEYSIAEKMVLGDEFWARGHFPGNPIFPGVLLVELMAQTGGLIFANGEDCQVKGYLSRVNKLKLIKKVIPNQKIVVKAINQEKMKNIRKVRCLAKVNDSLVASGEITYVLTKNL